MSFWKGLGKAAGSVLPVAGMVGGGMLGGPAGAMLGGSLGGAVGGAMAPNHQGSPYGVPTSHPGIPQQAYPQSQYGNAGYPMQGGGMPQQMYPSQYGGNAMAQYGQQVLQQGMPGMGDMSWSQIAHQGLDKLGQYIGNRTGTSGMQNTTPNGMMQQGGQYVQNAQDKYLTAPSYPQQGGQYYGANPYGPTSMNPYGSR